MASVKFVDNSDKFIAAKDEAVNRALEAIGIQAEGNAKLELENTPRRIDTGNLRNSISYSVQSNEEAVYIGTNVEYAPYVHDGTIKMAANRFLKNAAERNAAEYKAIAEQYLKG
jgi:HK97 gp10 family phage protein